MDPVKDVLRLTADYAAQFLGTLDERPVRARHRSTSCATLSAALCPRQGREDAQVLAELIAGAEPGVVGTPTGRYFGFVIGSALPASVAADWLTSIWDQNGASSSLPGAAAVEDVARGWLRELLGLPDGVSAGFVTGCQGAHDGARRRAPPRPRAGRLGRRARRPERRAADPRPRRGRAARDDRPIAALCSDSGPPVEPVAADDQGRMRADALRDALAGSRARRSSVLRPERQHRSLRPVGRDRGRSRGRRRLAARRRRVRPLGCRSPRFRHLVAGVERADSWATDAPQVAERAVRLRASSSARIPDAHARRWPLRASYLEQAEPDAAAPDWVPESSRRARGFPSGRRCARSAAAGSRSWSTAAATTRHASRERSAREPGVEVLNDVVLNQVLVRFGDDDEITQEVVRRVQADGTCWLAGTDWQGRAAMRISVSSFQTTTDDVERARPRS